MDEKSGEKITETCKEKLAEREILTLFVTKERMKNASMANKNIIYKTHLRRLHPSLRVNKIF
ncbi:MAG: hypothetical protein LBG48_00945 [Rickettsiales bacterium]|jgi:hypothetical protein|nr:hypothetical protein [Rickettsiales bacterium]